jgi:hypothetical protein
MFNKVDFCFVRAVLREWRDCILALCDRCDGQFPDPPDYPPWDETSEATLPGDQADRTFSPTVRLLAQCGSRCGMPTRSRGRARSV